MFRFIRACWLFEWRWSCGHCTTEISQEMVRAWVAYYKAGARGYWLACCVIWLPHVVLWPLRLFKA